MNILIGSNGGLTGIYLAKQIKEMSDVFLIGADSSDVTTGKFFVDEQCKLPRARDDKFISELVRLLNEKKIDIYLPTHSVETRIVSKNEYFIKKMSKARFLVSPYITYSQLENKRIANQQLSDKGIPVPKLIQDEKCEYPIIMKNSIGSGSIGTVIIKNEMIHKAYKETCENVVFFQMIDGKEYTLDCMFDQEGGLIGYNQRERIKMIGGAVSITTNSNDFDIKPWLDIIIDNWYFCGCVNFQYIVKDNVPYFIDINLRYPSGGLPLSVKSGLNIPQLTIDALLGRKIRAFNPPQQFKDLTMYRYYEEIFE